MDDVRVAGHLSLFNKTTSSQRRPEFKYTVLEECIVDTTSKLPPRYDIYIKWGRETRRV